MTRDEAIENIRMILGFRSADFRTDDIIKTLKWHQNELEKQPELPYFLRTEILNMTNTINVERMPTPAGFLKEWEEDAFYIQDVGSNPVTWTPLEKDGPEYLRTTLQAEGPGTPKAYSYDGTEFILFPTPDAVFTYRMIYYKKDVVLDTNIENKWLENLPYLLIGRAGAQIASGLRDQVAVGLFGSLIAEGTVRLNSLTVSRDGANRRYIVGGPD